MKNLPRVVRPLLVTLLLIVGSIIVDARQVQVRRVLPPSNYVAFLTQVASPQATSAQNSAPPQNTASRSSSIEWIPLIEVVGFAIALIALALGIVHLFVLHRQANEIRAQAKLLQDQAQLSKTHSDLLKAILDTQSTHHIGQFPEYLKIIAAFIETATKDVEILCDLPGYGSFSDPVNFLSYRHAIEKKLVEGVPIRATCLHPESRIAIIKEQFLKTSVKWGEWRAKHRELLTGYFRQYDANLNPASVTSEQFISAMMANLAENDRAFKGVDFSITKEYIPLYFWLVDGVKAVFAIPSFSERGTEHGFTTADPHLIAAFRDLRTRYERLGVQDSVVLEAKRAISEPAATALLPVSKNRQS